ncbi:MAG: DUF4282 domain-containing protein [Candidatus Moranbacteria bacterium]|jgi:hypothetical protein|nr:DUF4282 domain-containing protein [Candidatus Moranbacteria bacterium]
MNNFLTFKTFISSDILIFFYYIGAVLIPILLWQSRVYLKDRFKIIQLINEQIVKIFSSLSNKEQSYAKLFILFAFISMEIIWRMMFEVMIAYFDMRDYLQQIAG